MNVKYFSFNFFGLKGHFFKVNLSEMHKFYGIWKSRLFRAFFITMCALLGFVKVRFYKKLLFSKFYIKVYIYIFFFI
jgi:hypothetical protein